VPQDIGLIGMDNTPLAHVMNPPLTTVGYNLTAAARASAGAALYALGEGELPVFDDFDLRVHDGEST
jgi:DNA-binding LacI/PurR family transcriptional regulator